MLMKACRMSKLSKIHTIYANESMKLLVRVFAEKKEISVPLERDPQQRLTTNELN